MLFADEGGLLTLVILPLLWDECDHPDLLWILPYLGHQYLFNDIKRRGIQRLTVCEGQAAITDISITSVATVHRCGREGNGRIIGGRCRGSCVDYRRI